MIMEHDKIRVSGGSRDRDTFGYIKEKKCTYHISITNIQRKICILAVIQYDFMNSKLLQGNILSAIGFSKYEKTVQAIKSINKIECDIIIVQSTLYICLNFRKEGAIENICKLPCHIWPCNTPKQYLVLCREICIGFAA